MYEKLRNHNAAALIDQKTVRKIRYGVVIGHAAVLILPLAVLTVIGWFSTPKEKTITASLYDPTLDNVVENPSLDPDPDNPIPPSGTPDATPEAAFPDPQNQETSPQLAPPPELPPAMMPEPMASVQPVNQPQAKSKPREINTKLPEVSQPKTATPKQPKAPKAPKAKQNPKTAQRARQSSIDPKDAHNKVSGGGKPGPRGTNPDPGHTAPGGQRGNSGDGYGKKVADMLDVMWDTPDVQRLGGRKPEVLIELTIAPDGRVKRKRIKKASGVHAMDESVRELLNKLVSVIPPNDGKECTLEINMRIKD